MITIEVRPFIDDVDRDLRRRVNGTILRQESRKALISAGRRIRTLSAREVSDKTGVGFRVVRRRVFFSRPKAIGAMKVNAYQLRVLAHNLSRAKPKQTKAGASVGRRSFPGHFVATMPNPKLTSVFKRSTSRRLPIVEGGVSLSPAIETAVPAAIAGGGRREFIKTIERNLRARLRRDR